MQAQVKYKSEIKTAVLGDRTITVKNLTPVFSPQELEKHNREIEQRLFDVFRKYAGQRVRGDFSPRRTSDKHQRRRWAWPVHGHDPPLDKLAACPSGSPFLCCVGMPR